MLDHCADSVGSALPGGGAPSESPLVSQTLTDVSGLYVPVPTGAIFAFVEIVGASGTLDASGASPQASAGAGGADVLMAVSAGSGFSTLLADGVFVTGTPSSTVSYNGGQILSVGNVPSNGQSRTAGSGKYPGEPASGFNNQVGTASIAGKGGGRLAGSVGASSRHAGYGSGAVLTSGQARGSRAAACFTFFRTYDAALAFANSLYGGNWQP